jgi:hypothetical protein
MSVILSFALSCKGVFFNLRRLQTCPIIFREISQNGQDQLAVYTGQDSNVNIFVPSWIKGTVPRKSL